MRVGQPGGRGTPTVVSFRSSAPWAFFSRSICPVSQAVRAIVAARSMQVAACMFISIAPEATAIIRLGYRSRRGTWRPSSKSCRSAQAVRSVREGSTASLSLLKYSCFSGVLGSQFRIIWFYLKSIVMPDHKSKFLHLSCSAGSKLLRYKVAPWPENRRTHAYHGRAFGNGDIHIF